MQRHFYSLIFSIVIYSITLIGYAALSPDLANAQVTNQGFTGVVMDKESGVKIRDAKITFVKENSNVSKNIVTENNGSYRIDLNGGRYIVKATHPDYDPYSSSPGFFVVRDGTYQTGNIFMKKRVIPNLVQVTTVLVVRHAEKGPEQANDMLTPLNSDGLARAEELAHVAEKAGVTAIYATEFLRTQQTVQPLATKLGKTIIQMPSNDVPGLVNHVLTHNAGKVVIIASHEPIVPMIIQAFGGGSVSLGGEYDNLFVVTIYAHGKAKVINLQYGKKSP